MTRRPLVGPGGLFIAALLLFSFSPIRSFGAMKAPAHDPAWRQIGLSGITVHSLVLGKKTSSPMYAGTQNGVYRRDGTGQWRQILSVQSVWSIVAPSDRTVVVGDNAGDVYVTSDGGSHWRHTQVTLLGVYAVSTQPGNARHILAGGGNGIYASQDGGRHWKRRLRLPGSSAASFIWKPGSSRVVAAGAIASSPKGSTQVYLSNDGGSTWRVFGIHLNSQGGIMSLGITSTHLFAGTMGNAVWSAPLKSGAWHQTADGMPLTNDHVASLATMSNNSGQLFAGTLGYGVFRTTDGGKRWRDVSQGLALDHSAGIVLSLTYSPARHAVYAGTADGVYELALAGTAGGTRT